MSEPTALTSDLDGDLRRYFAVTTSSEMPRRVREMSARTLGTQRRRPMAALLGGGLGALATAALVFAVATHVGSHGNPGTTSLPAGAGSAGGAAYASPQLVPITYPGIDTTALADSVVALLPPAGHGSAVLTPAEAQARAQRSIGAGAGSPGPAVLTFAELRAQPPGRCLCWVVDIPVPGGVSGQPPPAPQTELVLVDADSGRIVAALSGHGIP